jgi:D-serine dehydratase
LLLSLAGANPLDDQRTESKTYSLIAPLNKGIGYLDHSAKQSEAGALGWNLLREDLSLPAAVLYDDKIQHNLRWMRQFIDAYDVRLSPHGKTSMAPRLFQMQLEAGAWGITLATAHQTRVAFEHGVRRVLLANQLIGKSNMQLISHLLCDPQFEFYCLVDSAAQIDQLGTFFSAAAQRLNVLVELGVTDGRSGVRNDLQLQFVLGALARWSRVIDLCGVEIYEGVLADEASIRAFLRRAVAVTQQLASTHRFQRSPVLLSGAGSAWYDVVAEEFCSAKFEFPVEIVLRPGGYITHDVGAYRAAQKRILANNPIARDMHEGLLPALHVWAYVQSIPEIERAIIGMGRRDVAFDSGLPVPALHYRPGSAAPVPAPAHWSVSKLMDQHAYLQFAPADDLLVGDMVGFDIAHPCLTFDKWRVLPLLNADFDVIDLVQTYF